MNNKEKEIAIKELLENSCLTCLKVNDVNHTPHPYMIGSKHITHASDNHGGRLGEATLKAVPCAYNCGLSYEEHTSDNVAFLQAVKDCTKEEINIELNKIVEKFGEKFLDGFAFVESKFKIN